jgi:hypothetical protein
MDTAEARGIHRRTTFEVTPSLRLRFEARVNRRGPQECWPWIGSQRNGYGAIKHGDKVLGTHVVAFVIANGPILEGRIVTHDCDNRTCCNPAHLTSGTPESNVAEMNQRRRAPLPCGENKGNAKLNAETVASIFTMHRSGMSRRKIAAAVGVHDSTVRGIIERRRWQHVEAGWV